MAKKRVLKLMLWVMSLPQIALSRCMEILSSEAFRADLKRCIECVDRNKKSVPMVFVDAVVTAEDHRNVYHPGIDPLGIFRALYVHVVYGRIEGASTIEQQFVRVVTARYERTISRKVREQLLAIAVARHHEKVSIASAYLAVAFYGSNCIGLSGLNSKFGYQLDQVTSRQALRFISQLKYPCPLQTNPDWYHRIDARTEMLWMRGAKAANKSLQRTFDPQPMLLPQHGLRLKRH